MTTHSFHHDLLMMVVNKQIYNNPPNILCKPLYKSCVLNFNCIFGSNKEDLDLILLANTQET
jgi:sterol desaturase/sphingolipid hydroxylase (fatty acid hydroxylase superfamily)